MLSSLIGLVLSQEPAAATDQSRFLLWGMVEGKGDTCAVLVRGRGRGGVSLRTSGEVPLCPRARHHPQRDEDHPAQVRHRTAPECLPSYGCVNRRAPFLPSSLFDSSSLDLPASCTLPHSHPRDAAFELAPRRPDRTFSCQTGFPRIQLPRPFRSSSRRSLKNNGYISDQAKQAVRDAADSGVSIEF